MWTACSNSFPASKPCNTINNLGYQEIKVLVNGSTDGFVGQVSYYLDGGLNMTGLRNSGNQVPNPDAVSQFNVVTNNYSAQLGRYSSGGRQHCHQERHQQLPRFCVRVLPRPKLQRDRA